jgi:hypothetical protein
LKALGSETEPVEDNALALGGLNWAMFFQAQSDTAAKLAAFVYAVLHLEIGGYELLMRTARRVHDDETSSLCEHLILEKRTLAEELASTFDSAVNATLYHLGEDTSRVSSTLPILCAFFGLGLLVGIRLSKEFAR